ncbi:MAG: 6-bladed beta-propeller, partial [Desulfomonilaceae bacterium]
QYAGPFSVVVDPSSNIFVSDSFNHRILKYDANGNLICKWGANNGAGGPYGYGSLDGQFFVPRQIAVDSGGNVYVADSCNNRIQKFDNTGKFVVAYGSLGTLPGYFQLPTGVAVDNNGNIFVADTGNNRIEKFNPFFQLLTYWGSYGTGNGQFDEPMGLAIDSQNNVYVVDRINNRVQKFNNDGTFITKWGTNGGQGNSNPLDNWGTGPGDLFLPTGIAIDANNNVFVTDTSNDRMEEYDSSGNYLGQFGQFSATDGNFFSPQGVGITKTGHLIIPDGLFQRIVIYSYN